MAIASSIQKYLKIFWDNVNRVLFLLRVKVLFFSFKCLSVILDNSVIFDKNYWHIIESLKRVYRSASKYSSLATEVGFIVGPRFKL